MGKGVIKSHIGDGKYNVEIQYDRSGIDEQITELESLIEKLDEVINDPESTETQIQYAKINKFAAQKRINYLESPVKVPESEEIEAWCADLTTDLSGDVGTVEVAREREHGINIQPGYSGNAAYDSARDGILKPNMALSAKAVWINMGFLPGAQKWRPSFRYGEITSIDNDADTCNVSLESQSSSQQALNVNQSESLSDVPISYMDCDSAAFSVGDSVLVRFIDYDWEHPEVVGFKDNPRPCKKIFVIISSPSGSEAFAWDAVENEIYAEKDTYENVVAEIGGAASQLVAEGEYSRSEYPWDYRVPPEGSLTIITVRSGYEDTPRIVQHPTYTTQILLIEPLAFGGDNDERRKWEHGDQVVLSTSEGSGSVTLVLSSTEDGEFNTDYAYVDASKAVDQTWTIDVYEGPNDADDRFIVVTGDTFGAIDDFQYYDIGRTLYPLTPSEVAAGEDAAWLDTIGFQFDLTNGNYVEDNGNTLAPVVYHWTGKASSAVSSIKSEYESLTEETAPTDDEMERRTQLFYIPILGWRWTEYTFGPYLNWLNYYNYAIDQILDTWADSDYSGGSPENEGHLYMTTGRSEKGSNVAVYDAFNLSMNDDYTNGLHLFFKCPAASVLSQIENEIFVAANSARSDNGLGALQVNLALQWAAQRHADDMAENYEYYKSVMGNMAEEHEGTDGTRVGDRALDEGYYDFWRMRLTIAGENLQYVEGDLSDFDGQYVVDGWMDSPGHMEILLETTDEMPDGETWRDTGVAHAVAEDGTHFFCQTFSYLSEERAGFSPMPADGAKQYMDDNFNWSGSGDETRIPKVYLA